MAKAGLVLLLLLPFVLSNAAAPTKVIFDHDGGIDDFVTLLLLLSKPNVVEVIGITILDADCIAAVAANTTVKLLQTLGASSIPVAVSTLQGVNPFPDLWRWSPLSVDVQPLINNVDKVKVKHQLVDRPGQDWLGDELLAQPEPVVIVATGPLSNIAYVLEKHGEAAASKIKEVWWMGGSLHVSGNVHYPGHDGSAEWNAFWDPPAMGVVWNSSVPLVLVPLDVTNHVPVTLDLLYRFGGQADHKYSVLAGTIWSRVISWVYERPNEPYFAWDTLTAACLMQPDLCKRDDTVHTYAVVSGASQGRTVASKECQAPDVGVSRSRNTPTLMHVDAEEFYSYILDALRRS